MNSSISPIPCSPKSSRARLAVLALSVLPGLAGAMALQSEQGSVYCAETRGSRLHCDYRLQAGGAASGATLSAGGASLSATKLERYVPGSDTTAVLFLVDTSDPGRQAVMARYAEHIGRFLALGDAKRRFGLASFDAGLVMLDPVGSEPGAISRSAAALKATGMTTELYRNAIEAIRQLAAVPASRRELVMFSDGLAEDTAYHHEDVVRAAREANVVVSAIGYPRSVALAVGMQTLRRLAEDTGGMFAAAAGPQSALAAEVFPAMLAAAESGGSVEFDLDALAAAGSGEAAPRLALQTAAGEVTFDLPLVLKPKGRAVEPAPAVPVPPPATGAAPAGPTLPAAAPAGPSAPDTTAAERRKRKEFVPPRGVGWPIAMATPVILILGIAWAFIVMARRRRAEEPLTLPAGPEPAPASGGTAPRSHAFLVAAADPRERYAITGSPWRIGRSRNNDLRLEDRSVSRLHAEIRLNDQGRYVLCDLASANGVFVNDARIGSAAVLEEGDRVEIGEVGFRFTCHDEHYEAEEPTVMIRTRTPQ